MTAAFFVACAKRREAPALAPVQPPLRSAPGGVLPAGTTISLRTVGRIEPAAPARAFDAVLTTDAAGLLFSGSPARLSIRPEGLALAAVMIHGNWYAVAADDGGAALLGALMRGLIESARPGTEIAESMAIRTSGPMVQAPAGSLLIFRLDQPARVNPKQPPAGGNTSGDVAR